MRIRMGQFEALSEDLVYEGKDRNKLYEDQYKFGVYNERSRSVEKIFNQGYQMAFPPFGNRERQHEAWGTCIDLVHAIEHQQWLDAPEDKKEAPGTTYRSHGPVPLGREPYPKIERVEE